MPNVTRCEWAAGSDELMLAYHDEEWGVPSHDDRHLFEMLTLEGAQAGLSWSTILRKREGYRRAFAGFDPRPSRASAAQDVERLLADPGIVRNRLKVESTVHNAGRVLEVQDELGSLDAYLWAFVDGAPIVNACRDARRSFPPRPTCRRRSPRTSSGAASASSGRRYLRVHADGRHGRRPHGRLLPPVAVSTAPIQYARSGDVNIAYQVTGDGPFDLVLIHGFFSHLEIDWELPASRYVNDRLGSFARLIRFDKRGTGLSDRNVGLPDLESRMDDVRAVMDAVGSESAALFGYSEGGPLAVLFAATYPERVRALVLYGTYAKRRDPDDDYPWAPTWDERRRRSRVSSRRPGAPTSTSGRMWPDPDEAEAAWFHRRGRASLSPAGARDLILMNSQVDVRDVLPTIQCPTLVVHRTGDRDAQLDEGRYIARTHPGSAVRRAARRRPHARRRPTSRPRRGGGVPHRRPAEAVDRPRPRDDPLHRPRRLDAAGDASSVTRRGRRSSLGTMRAVRAELDRFDGEEIDTAGDGFLALFDGPARAIRCGLAIRDSLAALGLDVRAGVHTGEVERPAGEKPRGIAVHVGARVMSLARRRRGARELDDARPRGGLGPRASRIAASTS